MLQALDKSTLECTKVKERNIALAKELAAHKLYVKHGFCSKLLHAPLQHHLLLVDEFFHCGTGPLMWTWKKMKL